MYTADDVKKMNVNEILRLIERKTGKPVSSSTSLWLAMAHGASKGGGSLHVCDLGRGETRHETVDYEALAELFNQPDVPRKPRPEFVLRIPKPDHFLETWEEAGKVGGKTLERFEKDILFLIRWAMQDYRNRLNIYPDFCEHSFYWTMEQGGRVVFNGGLIKHGKGEEARWSIHT